MCAVSISLFIVCCGTSSLQLYVVDFVKVFSENLNRFNTLRFVGVRLARLDLTATTVSGTTNCHCHTSAATNKILSMCVLVFTESLLIVVIISCVLGASILILVAALVAMSFR